MIEIKCPHCEKLLHIPDMYAEYSGICNACHNHLIVPAKASSENLFKTCKYFSWTGGNIDISTFRCRLKGIHGQEIEDAAFGLIPEKNINADMCKGCTDYEQVTPQLRVSDQAKDF